MLDSAYALQEEKENEGGEGEGERYLSSIGAAEETIGELGAGRNVRRKEEREISWIFNIRT